MGWGWEDWARGLRNTPPLKASSWKKVILTLQRLSDSQESRCYKRQVLCYIWCKMSSKREWSSGSWETQLNHKDTQSHPLGHKALPQPSTPDCPPRPQPTSETSNPPSPRHRVIPSARSLHSMYPISGPFSFLLLSGFLCLTIPQNRSPLEFFQFCSFPPKH